MANLNFPISPNPNDTFEANGRLWVWNGTAWIATSIGEVNIAGITWEGTWDNATTYNTGDGVSYEGAAYIATQESLNQAPADPSDYWDIMLAAPNIDGKADKNNVLELDNTTEFTPDADYEPATKKYVDDNIPDVSGLVEGPASATVNNVTTFAGSDGKSIKDSGFTLGTSVPIDAVFTDTTYTAGAGITLSGTTFSLTANSFSNTGSYLNVAVGELISQNTGNTEYTIWVGTQAEYDLLTPSATTIYFVTD